MIVEFCSGRYLWKHKSRRTVVGLSFFTNYRTFVLVVSRKNTPIMGSLEAFDAHTQMNFLPNSPRHDLRVEAFRMALLAIEAMPRNN